ncbi:MAG: phenylacetate--CoA ligase family protein [Alphaproteobacteria bacterium]|nr:phenylacetate--CoA ligase family protein [Alphaproteobacteria bacterium]
MTGRRDFPRIDGVMLKGQKTSVDWPAIPSAADAATLALLVQFEESEWWSEDKILDHQLRQLGSLLSHFQHTCPYFKDRLDGDPRTLDLDAFRRIPILTRTDIQDAGDALLSTAIPKNHGRLLSTSSSGSTGRPINARKTDVNQTFHRALNLRNHLWHRHDLDAKFGTIRGYAPDYALAPNGKYLSSWTSVYKTGPSVVLNSTRCTVGEQLHWIMKERPAYILSYPHNFHALALRCRETGIKMPWLKALLTFSEALSPGKRAIIEDTFGVLVEDMYSAAEVSMIALQCPEEPGHYHVQSENVLVEVVDENGAPCAPGKTGRLLVTDLHNFAMPFVRYEIGDLAIMGSACSCGRGLPVLKRIFGRVRNMLYLANGEQVDPDIAALHLHEIAPLRQYQMIQKSYTDIDMKLVLTRPLSEEEASRMRNLIITALGQPFTLNLIPVDDIPRHPSGKFEDFMSEMGP